MVEREASGWWDQRFSRRQLLAGGATAAAGLALAAACGGDGEEAAPGVVVEEGEPRPGGILKLRQGLVYPHMSPFGALLSSLAQGLFLGFTVFDHLWYVPTDTGEVVLFLADSVEAVDPEGLTYIAKMNPAVFHDKPPVNGRPVVASDVAASFKRFRADPPFGFSWLHHVLDDVEATDDETVVFTQKTPWAWFFTSSNAGSPWWSAILPEEILLDTDFLKQDAIGSGRWMLHSHDSGSNVKLRKFPNWREPGLPYLDGVDFKLILENAQAMAAFAAQDIDTVSFPTRLDAEAAQDQLGNDITVTTDLSRAYRTLMLGYREPFLDDRVRHAINLAVDRQELIDALDFGDGVMAPPVPPAHKLYTLDESDSDLKEYFRHDPTEARQLLEAAGFPFDREIEFKFGISETNQQLVQVLVEQLSEVGLKIKTTPQDLLTVWLIQTLASANFEMTAFTHLAYEDPDLPLRFFLSSTSERVNFMGYADEEVDEAILAAARELEEERRVELAKEAQRVLIRKWAPQFHLYAPINYGAHWNYVKGGVYGRGSFGLFNSRAWLDKPL